MEEEEVAREVEDEEWQAEGEKECVGEGCEDGEGGGDREEGSDAGAWRMLAVCLADTSCIVLDEW